MAVALATEALGRWLEALNAPQDRAVVLAAVSDDVVVLRHGNYDSRGEVVEQFEGGEQVVEWFSRCPPRIRFELVSGPRAGDADQWIARYAIMVDDFRGGGELRFRIDEQPRIVWLEHVPDELAERYRLID